MDSSAAQNHHHQEMCNLQTLESMVVSPKSQAEKKPRPAEQAALHCPRCDSTNTKFCYYNNYSLSQPRYFCKSCRRYWTKGGTLRNVPVGGGCRKNKRSSPSTSRRTTTHNHPITAPHPASFATPHPGDDLSLAIATLQQKQPFTNGHDLWRNATTSDCVLGTTGGLFEVLTSEFLEASSFQNVYNGMENGGLGLSGRQEMGPIEGLMMGSTTTASTAMTTVKQEGEGKVLWGFPWQNIFGDEFDSVSKINWCGLVNSPLI